jgi:hypothetical protein
MRGCIPLKGDATVSCIPMLTAVVLVLASGHELGGASSRVRGCPQRNTRPRPSLANKIESSHARERKICFAQANTGGVVERTLESSQLRTRGHSGFGVSAAASAGDGEASALQNPQEMSQ